MELRKTLANGVEVIASTNPQLRTFCATVRFRAGSAYEKVSENGITHLLEHCIVRNMRGYFQEDFYVLLTRSGLFFNARTGSVRTDFEICGSPVGIPMAAQMLRKMFLPIRLGAKAFRVEKERVLAEMVYRQSGGPHADIDRIVWAGSPVGQSPLGTRSRVNRFSRNRLNAHLQSLLVRGNVQLCLTGGISDEDLALLLEAAAEIPVYEGEPMPKELPPPRHFGKREDMLHYPADVDYFRFVFDVDPVKCPKAVMDLIREILFCGSDALFYRYLSEETGLIYGYGWPYVEFRNFGTMEFGFHVDMNRMRQTVGALQKTIQMLTDGEYDLESKKWILRTGWEAVHDNPVLLNERMLHNMMLSDTPEPPAWENVTKEEIAACAEAAMDQGVFAVIHREDWEAIQNRMQQLFAPEAPG